MGPVIMKLELQEAAAEHTRNYIHWRELFQGGYYQEERKKRDTFYHLSQCLLSISTAVMTPVSDIKLLQKIQ